MFADITMPYDVVGYVTAGCHCRRRLHAKSMKKSSFASFSDIYVAAIRISLPTAARVLCVCMALQYYRDVTR